MSFNQSIQRLGFACKYMHPDRSLSKKLLEEKEKPRNGSTTTRAWLNRQTLDNAYKKLWQVQRHNMGYVENLIKYVGGLDPQLRMVRLGSEIMPMYTEETWCKFYRETDVMAYIEKELKRIGDLARSLDVRLSMHPGQFTVLASDTPSIVENSILEMEYHTDIARMMGYGKQFQDFKINVHISGRKGPDGIRTILPRLSTECRNMITIENDEMSWGLDSTIELARDVALVIDIHHHWVATGEYLRADDPRVQVVKDSWRGVRPAMHYSLSREDMIGSVVDPQTLPDHQALLQSSYKKGKLRAHSDYMWNSAANDWAGSFRDQFDIMVEAKAKNLATQKLWEYYKKHG